jgi:hypothetical protein
LGGGFYFETLYIGDLHETSFLQLRLLEVVVVVLLKGVLELEDGGAGLVVGLGVIGVDHVYHWQTDLLILKFVSIPIRHRAHLLLHLVPFTHLGSIHLHTFLPLGAFLKPIDFRHFIFFGDELSHG